MGELVLAEALADVVRLLGHLEAVGQLDGAVGLDADDLRGNSDGVIVSWWTVWRCVNLATSVVVRKQEWEWEWERRGEACGRGRGGGGRGAGRRLSREARPCQRMGSRRRRWRGAAAHVWVVHRHVEH